MSARMRWRFFGECLPLALALACMNTGALAGPPAAAEYGRIFDGAEPGGVLPARAILETLKAEPAPVPQVKPTAQAHGDVEPRLDEKRAHPYVAIQAAYIFGIKETPEIRFGAYLARSEGDVDVRREDGTICGGAYDEDHRDHIDGYLWPFTMCSHFWEADEGDCSKGLCRRRNAWRRGTLLWSGPEGVLPFYLKGDKARAYDRLGHVAHLLADMATPAHAHREFHGSDRCFLDDSYEDWMADGGYRKFNHNDAGGVVPIPWDKKPADMDSASFPLYYLFYTANQHADYFASDRTDGNARQRTDRAGWLDYSGWPDSPTRDQDLADNDPGDNDDDGDFTRIASKAFVYSIGATATLYKLFWETTHPRCEIPPVSGSSEIEVRALSTNLVPAQAVEIERRDPQGGWRSLGSAVRKSRQDESHELWSVAAGGAGGMLRARMKNAAGVYSDWCLR